MASPGNYLIWAHVTHMVPKLGFIFSTIFGSILLFLNILGAQKNFGSYKYLISAITVLGMTFSAAEILVYPNVHNFNAGSLFFSFQESLGLSGVWRNMPLAGYTFFHCATMAVLSVQFIYRYWAVFDTNKLKYFKGSYALIWLIYCSYLGFQYSIGTYYFFMRDPVSDEYFRKEIFLRYNANISELPAMVILAYDPNNGSVRWWNLMGILNICAIVNFQYGIMIYCGWSMQNKMEDKIKNLSETLRKRHKQFFKTLVIQITTPTIILFIPLTVMICLPILNLNVRFPSGIMLCSFTLYPAMDSIIVMSVVSEYRHTVKRYFKLLSRRFSGTYNNKVSISAVSGTSMAATSGVN